MFKFKDGTSGSLISAVPIRLSCGQVNYRAYVNVNGVDGVWFFGTSLDSKLTFIPKKLWKMPWHRDSIKITNSNSFWQLKVVGDWGFSNVEMSESDNEFECLDGFSDLDESIQVLTHPMEGWYERSDGHIGTYSVWHQVLKMKPMVVKHAHFKVFETLGLINSETPIHSALMQRTIKFDVHTPPNKTNIIG